MSFSFKRSLCSCVFLLAFAAQAFSQTPVSTAFTYQGQLKSGGSPANGNFNMAFNLFDAPTVGNQIGPTMTLPTVAVANGLFTVQLDFGVNAYTANQARWLEIAINGTTLLPRQPLTPTPFALNTRGLSVDAAGNVGIGTSSPAQQLQIGNYGSFSDQYLSIKSVGGNQFRTGIKFRHFDDTVGFTIEDDETSPINGLNIIRYPYLGTPSSSMYINHFSGNVGLGTTAPSATLHVVGNGNYPHARIAARDDSSTPYGVFFSLDATPTTGGKDWWLFSTGASAGEGPGKLVFENISDQVQAMVIAPNGYVGIGTAAPQCRLDVKGKTYVDPNSFGGAPTISLAVGDTDTGLNSSGDGNLDIYSNNVNAMSIRGGTVGIGTTSPVSTLSVAGDVDISGSRFHVGTNGKVGIGTQTPGYPLDVVSLSSGHAVRGTVQTGGDGDAGIYGISHANNGNGLIGECSTGSLAFAIWGKSTTGFAGYFDGNVRVNGTLSKSAGSFKIDHPLDPDNKYLSHSFVESPDMKNIYDGIATLDAVGQAVVELPDWFSALNKDFRYQLTAIGSPGPNLFISQEVTNNHFIIAGGRQGMKVSWQVTGIRHDAYADAHRIPVEEDKSASERGHYLHPDLFGKPPELSVSKHPPANATAHAAAQ